MEGGDTWDEDGASICSVRLSIVVCRREDGLPAVVVAAGVNQVVAGVLGEVVGCVVAAGWEPLFVPGVAGILSTVLPWSFWLGLAKR